MCASLDYFFASYVFILYTYSIKYCYVNCTKINNINCKFKRSVIMHHIIQIIQHSQDKFIIHYNSAATQYAKYTAVNDVPKLMILYIEKSFY